MFLFDLGSKIVKYQGTKKVGKPQKASVRWSKKVSEH
jgi:hypothetical protein